MARMAIARFILEQVIIYYDTGAPAPSYFAGKPGCKIGQAIEKFLQHSTQPIVATGSRCWSDAYFPPLASYWATMSADSRPRSLTLIPLDRAQARIAWVRSRSLPPPERRRPVLRLL